MRRIAGQTRHDHGTYRIRHLIWRAQLDTIRERLGYFIEHLISDIAAVKGVRLVSNS